MPNTNSSLSINQRTVKGHGWTDSPVLIYPSADQVGFVARIIVARKNAGDNRAADYLSSNANNEKIREMLNDEKVLTQIDRWRYAFPEELVKVETATDTEFAIRELACEELKYGNPNLMASSIPDGTSILDYDKDTARRFLALAHRINELRKMAELHYRHVHKIHFVYEDHIGYSLDGSDVVGGYVNYREYVGAITNTNQLTASNLIQFGSHFIDYTMPPTFKEDRAFSPDLFTGVKLNNPNIATSYQVPILNRVMPDLNASWIGVISPKDEANASWSINSRDVKPTPVKAEHINELRKAFSAYSAHVHSLVLQTVDSRSLRKSSISSIGSNGAPDISGTPMALGYADVRPPYYLKSLGDCLNAASGNSSSITRLAKETPLYHHAFYYGKKENNVLLSSLNGVLLYNDFQIRQFYDTNFPEYYLNPELTWDENAVMTAYDKPAKALLFNSLANDNIVTLEHSAYASSSVPTTEKAPDDDGSLPASMLPIPMYTGFNPVHVQLSTSNISDKTLTGPSSYHIGSGIKGSIGASATSVNVNAYEVEGSITNTGYIKVSFVPGNNLNKAVNNDSFNAYSSNPRMYLLSYGRDDCLATGWTPGAATDLPTMEYEFNATDKRKQFIQGRTHPMNLFVSVPDGGHPYKRKVYNSTGAVYLRPTYQPDRLVAAYTDGSNAHPQSTKARPSYNTIGIERRYTDDTRGLARNTGTDGNSFYFRQSNGVNTWNDNAVHSSMSNLIEIWLETSQFNLIDGYIQDNLYTVHAAIYDAFGGLAMHLCGDILINQQNAQDLWEVELNIDMRPGKSTQLAVGRSSLSERDTFTVEINNFNKVNNTILLSSTTNIKPDDLIIISGATNPANNGTFKIRKILSQDTAEIAKDDGAILIDETPGSPLVATIYKYEEIGVTTVLCSILSGDPSGNDLNSGVQLAAYRETHFLDGQFVSGSVPNTARFWHTKLKNIDNVVGHAVERIEAVEQRRSNNKYNEIINSNPLLYSYLGYKSPDSQIPGFYRHGSISPYSDIEQIKIEDFSTIPKIMPSQSITGKTVAVLGLPICALNMDDGNKLTKKEGGNGSLSRYNQAITIRRPITDAFDSYNNGTNMVTSNYNNYSGTFPITKHENVTSGPYAGKVRFLVRTSEVKLNDSIRILFGDPFSYYSYVLNTSVLFIENTNTNHMSSSGWSYAAQWVYVDITIAQVEGYIKNVSDFFNDFSNGLPGLLEIVGRKKKYIHPSLQKETNLMRGGIGFAFKGLTISSEPTVLSDHTTYGFKYNAQTTKRVRLTTREGQGIIVSSDGNDDHTFNQKQDSPIRSSILDALNHSGNLGADDTADVVLNKIIDTTKTPEGGSEVIAAFSNGNFNSDGYNVKQLKGAVRDPATGNKTQPGDLIKSTDINELYKSAEWLKNHTHLFSFTHTTDQPIHVEL